MDNKAEISLNGLHLLLTRPQQQAEKWAQQLQALGAQLTITPMLEISPLTEETETQAITDTLLQLDQYQKAIFVSQNAIDIGIEWIDRYWPQLPSGLDFFAIGHSSARLLAKKLNALDTAVTAPSHAMNSEALIALPQLHAIQDEKILIFRGQGGRTYLGKSLEARGALVDYCELYQRVLPDAVYQNNHHNKIEAFTKSPLRKVITALSGETLDNLCRATTATTLQWMQQQTLLVPGKRVAELAHEHGFTHLIIAENATHESMIEALNDWQKQE